MRSPPKRSGWTAGTLAVAATGGLFWLAGCSGGSKNPDGPTTMDMAMTTTGDMAMSPDSAIVEPGTPTKSTASIAIDRPLAAVLSPNGSTIYLTAHDTTVTPEVAALYSVPAAGGTPTKLTTTTPLIHPLGLAISNDGKTLFIADEAGGTQDAGVVYISDTSGNISATAITGVWSPSGLALSADGTTLYITGRDPTAGANLGTPGVFKVSAAGGTAAVVAEGLPFSSPSGITVAADGNIYVVDTTALGARQGSVIKIVGTVATSISTAPLQVGFPAGISQAGIGSTSPLLLVTGTTAGLGTGVVYSVTGAGVATPLSLNSAAGSALSFFDPATIHRAATATSEVWVAVDSVAATQATAGQQSGMVYVLTP